MDVWTCQSCESVFKSRILEQIECKMESLFIAREERKNIISYLIQKRNAMRLFFFLIWNKHL